VLHVLLESGGASFEGEFYSTRDIVLEPRPAQRPRPPIWVASWGSPSGLRLVAHHGDGWLASAYNTTPDLFRESLDRIADGRRLAGKPPESFTNAIATAWLYITQNTKRAESVLTDILAPMLKRPVEALRALSLPIGPAELCAERLSHFASSGAQRIFLWPLGDELAQLELFREHVAPRVVDQP
jgi:alkanesulfonate monooxygenase SsuD/methylene tetrahydromethanopterin reductase-like flavin-dependent oxidoreductase (luciferase family)